MIYITEKEAVRLEGTSVIKCPSCEDEAYNMTTTDGVDYPKNMFICVDCDKIIQIVEEE